MRARAGGLLRRLFSPVGVLVLATLVRLAFVLTMGNRYYFGDTAEYEERAMSLLAGHGLGTTLRAPLYPIFMAFGFLVGGPGNYVLLRLMHLGFSIPLIWLSGRVGRELGGRPAELIAMIVVGFSPTLVFVSGILYPTELYALLLIGITLTTLRLGEKPSVGRAAALGVLLGLGWLTDAVVVAPAAAAVVWLLARTRALGGPVAGAAAVALVVAAAVLAPYLWTQSKTSHGSSAFMDKAQFVLHFARTDPGTARERHVRLPADTPFVSLGPGAFLKREAGLFRAMPAAYLHDVAFEFLHFFQPLPDRVRTQNQYNRRAFLWIGALAFLPVLVLAGFGSVFGSAPARQRALLAMIVLATAAFYALFFTQTRYRIPVEPQFAVLAALGLQRLFPRLAAFVAGEGAPAGRAS